MGTTTLIELVANLASYDPELTVYAVRPWTCDSEAVVAREPEQGGLPHQARSCGAEYFIEVFVAKEFLEGWIVSAERRASAQERCERLIHYAVNDV
jgi:hypothetical protein